MKIKSLCLKKVFRWGLVVTKRRKHSLRPTPETKTNAWECEKLKTTNTKQLSLSSVIQTMVALVL